MNHGHLCVAINVDFAYPICIQYCTACAHSMWDTYLDFCQISDPIVFNQPKQAAYKRNQQNWKKSTKSMGYCTSTSEIYINCARAGMRAPTLVLTFHIQFNVNRQRFGYIRFMYSHTSNRFTMSVSAGCYLYGRYGRPCSIAARFAFIDLCMYRL